MLSRLADLTYCDCEKIMQLLQNTEEGRARNIFGQYTAQHMRTWAALLRSYEKDNLYVAEEARVLVNNTTYEMYVQRQETLCCDDGLESDGVVLTHTHTRLQTSAAEIHRELGEGDGWSCEEAAGLQPVDRSDGEAVRRGV
jgi:hypothetical protein